jgi:hypothetical protein
LNKFKEDGEFNIEKLVDSVRHLIYLNEDAFYAQTKRDKKVEEIAYTQLLYYLNEKLQHNGYENFYATYKQLRAYNNLTGGIIDLVIDRLILEIVTTRIMLFKDVMQFDDSEV